MDRGEPTLAPEWLKAAGSSSHSDEHNNGSLSRNRPAVSVCDHDAPRASSLSFRRSASSNGSMGHDKDNYAHSRAYSSFGTSHRGRDRDRQKEWAKDSLLDSGYNGYTDLSIARMTENDTLRRSHSMVSGRRAESLPKRSGSDSNNGVLSVGSLSGGFSKVSFERDFPSLGVEEKQGVSDVARVSSPGISTAINSLHISTPAIIGGDGWTSALAEVPVAGVGNGSSMSSALQGATNMVSTTSGTVTGLSMAETLAQAPLRARAAPSLSNENDRRKELTLMQYNKLIPVLNSSEKSKTKGARNGELVGPKGVQLPSSQLVNPALHLPATKSDILKTAQAGNFLVLNREKNGVSPTARDGPPQTTTSRGAALLGGIPSASSSPLKSPTNPKLKANGLGGEKKPQSQAQDRNHFFNSLRKQAEIKTGVSHHYSEVSCGESSPSSVSSISNPATKPDKQIMGDSAACVCQGNNHVARSNSGLESLAVENGDNNACDEESETFVAPDEKVFLESLGWSQNALGGGLTNEEILSFYKEHKEKLPPDFKHKAGLPESWCSGSC